jgi:hypothetical protein
MYNIDINRIPGRMNLKEVNEEDAVFEGAKIFEFFFEGTKFKNYKDFKGPKDFEGLKPGNFGHWIYIFDKCVAEMTERMQGSRPAIERWWDAVKKIILLYRAVGNEKQNRKVRNQRKH